VSRYTALAIGWRMDDEDPDDFEDDDEEWSDTEDGDDEESDDEDEPETWYVAGFCRFAYSPLNFSRRLTSGIELPRLTPNFKLS
jgi:hypothetical protein